MNKYPELKNLAKIAKTLNDLKVAYYVTGGFAVSIFGRPRFTADIDIVIKMSNTVVGDFVAKLQKIFPKGYIDESQINNALARQGEFNIIDPESGLKVDFFVTQNDEFEKECFKKARPQNLGVEINFTTAENLIISKLIWYKNSGSSKHLEDIESVMAIQKTLDRVYLRKWIDKLDLAKEWQKLKRKNI